MDNIELQKYAERDIDILRILNINTTFRGYYLNNDEVKCKDALNTILSDTSSLNRLNINNLMFMITATDNKEEIEKKSSILSKKLDTEPFYIEDLDYSCMLQVYHTYNSKDFIQKLPKDVISKISTNVKEREKAVKDKPISKIISKMDFAFDKANILTWYEKGEISDEKISVIEEMVNNNKNALEYVNYGIFKDNIYNNFSKETIERLSKFPNISAKLIQISNNKPELINVISDYFGKDNDITENIEDFDTVVNGLFEVQNEIDVSKIDFSNKENIMNWLIGCDDSRKRKLFKETKNPVDYHENYDEVRKDIYLKEFYKAKEKYEKASNNTNENISIIAKMDMKEAIEAKKEAYFQRTFGMSYKKASTFVIEYGSDLDNLENVDEEKEFFKNIKESLENEDMIESYISSKNTYSLYQVNNIKKKIAKECAKTYISKFENLDKKVDECLKSNDENYHEILEFDGKKIDMVKPKGKLDILLHSTDTNFLSARSTPESFKEIWENAKTKEDHILSSVYINQEFMGMPPVGNSGVMYGFTNIPKENIKLIGTSDINTYSRKFSFDSTTKQYMSANTIANSSRRVYDEVAIEKSTPNYVVLFDDSPDEVRQNTLKAASEFNIPVMYLDKLEIAKSQVLGLNDMLNTFKSTNDVNLLTNIINKYETNMAGWLLNRKQKEDLSHTRDIDNRRFEDMFNDIGAQITEISKNYIEEMSTSQKDKSSDLLSIAQTIIKEQQIYAKNDKEIGDKKISGTEMTKATSTIKAQLNEAFKQKGMENYIITSDTDYVKYIKMVEVAKNGICREKISEDEVKKAISIENKEKSKEDKAI